MANWCTNTIKIYSEHKDKLAELEKSLNEWTSKNYMDNGFGEKWLGNIVLGSGLGTIDEDEEDIDTDLECRGALVDIDLTNECLWISTATAWKPMLQMWVRLLEKYLPDGKIIYYAEEPGWNVYCSNDPDMKDVYLLGFSNVNEINEIIGYDINDFMNGYEIKEKDLRKCLQLLLKTDENDIETLIEQIASKYDENHLCILKYEFIEPEELD
ncbi:MAG: hypothetical protein IIX48_05115 [Lachnospiraceae bacterium]|nr:hypothetical protein [Lachnospiraceae bacterium]